MGSLPAQKKKPTPVFLFAHGSTMMLGEESEPARIWENIGNECLRRGVKRIVMMGAHWDSPYDTVRVSMNPDAKKDPVGSVTEARYMPYKMVADLEGGQRVIDMLRAAGVNAQADPKFEWVHDTFLIVIEIKVLIDRPIIRNAPKSVGPPPWVRYRVWHCGMRS
ncbi:dioxygenase [Fusarium phyllophilum]|uniref:Dioxygenase n=1 Tax=Fusarium phyllophilum TaxID=47803 RepID=A0A8H5NER9_9HYPO|nr:dioxygenase [Fusarium phyllophilum]